MHSRKRSESSEAICEMMIGLALRDRWEEKHRNNHRDDRTE
jgi:hypothetical protein